MLSNEKTLTKVAGVLLMVFLAVFSYFVCATKVPQMSVFTDSVSTLEDTKETVAKFSVATLGAAVAITLLPDDYATPLADELADLSKYFILILGMVFFEKLLVLEGIPLVFQLVIPFVCALFAIYIVTRIDAVKTIASKILVLALTLIVVVPAGTRLSNTLCSDYMTYVEETIEDATTGTDKVNEISASDTTDKGFFDKVSSAFQTAISGIKELYEYFRSIVKRCITSVAILIVSTCVIPVLTCLLLVWVLNQLFQFQTVRVITKEAPRKKASGETTREEAV